MATLYDSHNAWNECPKADDCELSRSFLELVDAMLRDVQHLKYKTFRARYRFAMEMNLDHKRITTVDILSVLGIPHYGSLASRIWYNFKEIIRFMQNRRSPMAFKEFVDSMMQLTKGIDSGRY